MQKAILIAVDNSNHSLKAVEYVISIASIIPKAQYTLLHLHPSISQFIMEEAEKDPAAKRRLNEIIKRNTDNAEKVLHRFKKRLCEAGIPEDDLKTINKPRISGLAKDILVYAVAGRFDAVVVGRRGISKAQEMLMGGVTRQLLEHTQVIPVWVVDRESTVFKIMLAVDGSESALRAIDHVSYMLEGNKAVTITLLHVKPKIGNYLAIDFSEPDPGWNPESNQELEKLVMQADGRRFENFFAAAVEKFRKAGIERRQLQVLEVDCHIKVGKTITKEFRQGKFGTVVIGRSGTNQSFFFGSVSKYVLENCTGGAIWLVP